MFLAICRTSLRRGRRIWFRVRADDAQADWHGSLDRDSSERCRFRWLHHSSQSGCRLPREDDRAARQEPNGLHCSHALVRHSEGGWGRGPRSDQAAVVRAGAIQWPTLLRHGRILHAASLLLPAITSKCSALGLTTIGWSNPICCIESEMYELVASFAPKLRWCSAGLATIFPILISSKIAPVMAEDALYFWILKLLGNYFLFMRY